MFSQAYEYAYDNYDGDNEYDICRQIAEVMADDIYESCDVQRDKAMTEHEAKLYDNLIEAIADVVQDNIDFGEIKREMESDAEEYYERQKAREGRY